MSDLERFLKFSECKICGTRYHVDQETGETRCNGRKINRCIAFHKEADPPRVQIENMLRFHEGGSELIVNRSDWHSPGGECEAF